MSHSLRHGIAVAVIMLAATACRGEPAFVRVAQARDLSAEITLQFITAVDASNKAIMAETDESAATFVGDAERARKAVSENVSALEPVLRELEYATEGELLNAFAGYFTKYEVLDRQILSLAVENTNRKAQRLAFGRAQQEADAFRTLVALAPPAGAGEWQARALAAEAVASVREIQALQAPHIAEAGDAAMSAMEARMAAAETSARTALKALPGAVGPAFHPKLAEANAAFDRFIALNREITALSRRNTNVRSLALSLNDKGKLTASCEDTLRALREGLAHRGSAATR